VSGERRVVVVDPGFLPTTRQMAIAVAEDVRVYCTPIAPHSDSVMMRLPVAGREARRRALPAALEGRVRRVQTATELLRIGLSRAGVTALCDALIWRRNIGVDAAGATEVRSGDVVIGQYGGCLESFRRARAAGATTVLDAPIAREQACQAILAEERRLRPDFADSIPSPRAVTGRTRRMDAEIELADAIVVGSRFAAASFEGAVDPARVHVSAYGVDARAFAPRGNSGRRGPLRVLFAGNITQRKGIGYLLDAMETLDPVRFELTLAGPIAGSGAGLRRYEGGYRHCGALRPTAMPAIMRDADVLVLPSLLEGSALVVLEAMASGLPVIVTPNAGADAVRDGVDGFEVPVRSAEAIAARLEQLERDDVARVRMGVAARARALGFTWDRFHAEFRRVLAYESVEAAA